MKNTEARKYFRFSMMNIGIMQVSCGIFGLILFLKTINLMFAYGQNTGSRLFLVPEAFAMTLYLLLGLTVLLRKKWTRVIQLIFSPLITLIVLEAFIFLGNKKLEDYMIAGLYVLVGAITIFYNLAAEK